MKKKTLSLLLVLAMVLGSFSFAFAAEEPAAMTEAEAGEFLKKAGVLEGNDAGDLMLDKALKRQDMVVLFSRLLGQEEEAKTFDGQPTFKDIRDKYYNPYLAWGQANKLIEGHTEERFGYNEEMTAQQYVTILLRALGYGEEAKDYDNVVAKAKELGLLKDVKVEKDTKITRGQMSVMTMNALGTNLKGEEKTLADKLNIELPAPPVPEKLEVKEVAADNLKEIKVVFNKAVDESVLDIDNYEFDDAEILDITYVEEENTAILLLDEALDNKEDYELTIDGIKDLEKVTKEFTAYDNTIPTVENVVALGTKAIKVTMSEPIKSVGIGDFKLDGKTIYGSVELPVVGREVVIKPYKTLEAKEYELTVGRLEDFAGFKSVESKHTFEVVEDSDKPVVEEVSATLESAVITFSEDIDKATVSRYNVYHGSKVYPESATKIAGNKVLVVFTADKALPVYETTLYVSGFADYSGNKMDAAEVKVKPSIDESRPEVLKAELQKDLKTIEIKFSKSVNKKDAEDVSNYTVLDKKDNKLTISEAKLDGRVVELVLGKALEENEEYTLKISGIRDNNKYPNVMFAYETKIAVGDVSSPVFECVSGSSKLDDDGELYVTKANLFFNKDMDLGTLSNPENYLVKLEDSNGATKMLSDVKGSIDILKGDGAVVLLEAKTKDKITHVGVLGVKDTTGKKISNYGEMKEIKVVDFELNSYVAKAKDTVVLEFSIPVEKAPISAFTVKNENEKVTLKECEISGNKVTLTVDGNKLNAGALNTIEIAKDEVMAYDGQKLPVVAPITLTDKIAPSIDEVKATYTAGEEKVVLTVKFDEKINTFEKVNTDLVVKKINGDDEVDFNLETSVVTASDTLVIYVPVENILGDADELKTAFSVEIVDGARFIDDGENVPKAQTVRTEDQILVKKANVNQDVPEGLVGVALTAAGNDGKITGLDSSKIYEYRLAESTDWIKVEGKTEITGLAAGTYEVRLAAKDGFNAGAVAEVTVGEYVAPQDQAAPTGLVGVAPTVAGNDGKITGTTAAMEYKLATAEDSAYKACGESETTGLAAGTYVVRLAAKEGYNAGEATVVVVPAE